MFVVIDGIPSNGTMVIVGTGQVGTQPTQAAAVLPVSSQNSNAQGSGSGSGTTTNNASGSSHTGTIIGVVIGAIAVIGILGALFGIFVARRRRAASRQHPAAAYAMRATRDGYGDGASRGGAMVDQARLSDSSAFVPLQQDNSSMAWNASAADLHSPYRDAFGRPSEGGADYDPYNSAGAVRHHSSDQRM
jgi:FlaG/FlaF family flagellin (archaellin)